MHDLNTRDAKMVSHRVPSWIRPGGKAEVIKSVWRDHIPPTVWYYIGRLSGPIPEKTMKDTMSQLFINPDWLEDPFGVFIARSTVWESNPFVLVAVGIDLPEVPLSIKLDKLLCPLYVVGVTDSPGYINFVEPELSEGLPLPELN